MVERMRYPTNQQTNQPTDTARGAFSHLKTLQSPNRRTITHDPKFLVACNTTPHPALSLNCSVQPSVRQTLLFLGFRCLWPHCPCPNDQVTSNTTPAHPHVTGVAVYPARFCGKPTDGRTKWLIKSLSTQLKEERERWAHATL